MLIQANALLFTDHFYIVFSQNVSQIVIFRVSSLQQIEKVAECKVTKSHEIADWLNDIPTGVVEGTHKDEGKLANCDSASSE